MAKSYKLTGHYASITDEIMDSPAYQDLKPPAIALLLWFLYIHRPIRNGRLSITTKAAMKLLKVTEKVACRAFYELAEHGFINLISYEDWYNSKGREWAITFLPVNNREPTNDYRQWKQGINLCPDLPRPDWLKPNNDLSKRRHNAHQTAGVIPIKTQVK